ncbi:hypothetical protein MTR_8g063950 [Medicago truncatula]|uniref:Uncharacterized protein n=1 Tax=Medicago truncatula TaxID=3880 RepID=A0A072TS11_MEDTR|nr:hypothetical protein MTR_8g063950 [Medicago truncatula]
MIEKLLEKWNRIKEKGCCMGETSGMERNLLLMDSILRNVRTLKLDEVFDGDTEIPQQYLDAQAELDKLDNKRVKLDFETHVLESQLRIKRAIDEALDTSPWPGIGLSLDLGLVDGVGVLTLCRFVNLWLRILSSSESDDDELRSMG